MLITIFAPVLYANVLYVPFPYATIQGALDNADHGDTVIVEAGTYVENITMKDGVALIGAGADVTTIDGNDDGRTVKCAACGSGARLEGFTVTNGNAIVLAGGMYNLNSTVVIADCIFVSNTAQENGGGMVNEDSTVTITGCTFSENSSNWGGGILSRSSSVNISECTFTSNTSTNNGGAVRSMDSSIVTITGCSFTGNTATDGDAGGIYSADGTDVTIADCLFAKNYPYHIKGAYTDGGGNVIQCYVDNNTGNPADYRSIQEAINALDDGDAIVVMPGTYYENINMHGKAITLQSSDPTNPQIVESTIIDGNASGPVIMCNTNEGRNTVITGFVITNGNYGTGGGMYNNYSNATVSNCIFRFNAANFKGGGIFNAHGSPSIINCTISGNTSGDDGGGIYSYRNTLIAENCIINCNTASCYGGGMCYDSCDSIVPIENCTFIGNTAENGGGIFTDRRSQAKVINCTFSGNIAYVHGGGIFAGWQSSATIKDSYFCWNTLDAAYGGYTDIGGNNFEFCQPPVPIVEGDTDGDGDVDMADFAAFAENWLEGVE